MTEPTPPTADENQLIAERREKLKALRVAQSEGKGVAFPNDFKPGHRAAALAEVHGETTAEALEAQPVRVSVAGRMMLKRVMGKASFATLQDATGRIQLYVTRDAIGEEAYADFKRWDLGDILGAEGTLMKTKTGELSVKVTSLRLLTKSLRPLPGDFYGMADQEQKYRQRYVDLITDEDARKRFVARSQGAEGSLQAQQATNQLLALTAKQQFQLQQMMAAQFRSEAIEQARRATQAQEARAATRKFLGSGSAYTSH